jgi:hypothetical protein
MMRWYEICLYRPLPSRFRDTGTLHVLQVLQALDISACMRFFKHLRRFSLLFYDICGTELD